MINAMYIQDFESLLSRKDSKNSAFKDLEIIFWFVFEKKMYYYDGNVVYDID